MRWYHSEGRPDDALNILRNVSKWNKKSFPENATLEPYYNHDDINESSKTGTYIDLFTLKYLKKTLVLCLMW